jgi:hypothetical protein
MGKKTQVCVWRKHSMNGTEKMGSVSYKTLTLQVLWPPSVETQRVLEMM